jgi:hypothetical protein
MNRLLQGDVGSGKTAVAYAAARLMQGAGYQTALMAPTEILAQQHLRTLAPLFEAAGLRAAVLTNGLPRREQRLIRELTLAGAVHCLIGTHSLLSEDLGFARLGLAIVDEQHRFGVRQRLALRQKALVPHLLVMTATPIPRTLALTAYGGPGGLRPRRAAPGAPAREDHDASAHQTRRSLCAGPVPHRRGAAGLCRLSPGRGVGGERSCRCDLFV